MQELEQNATPPNSLRSIKKKSTLSKILPIVLVIIIVGLGSLTGLVLSSRSKNTKSIETTGNLNELPKEVQESFAQTFKDEAEGTIVNNDELDKYAQGTHKLERAGGESQTVFLTSSVLDLDEYEGKKAKIFGETFGSQQVGWLMDVGKVEVIQ